MSSKGKGVSKKALPTNRPDSSKAKSKQDGKGEVKQPTEKEKRLQEEIDGLEKEVLMLRCNLNPAIIEEKIRKENMNSEENIVSMLNSQIRRLEYELQKKASSGALSSTNDSELQQKIDKLAEKTASQEKEITHKNEIILTLERKCKEFENFAAARLKDMEQNSATTENKNSTQLLDNDVLKNLENQIMSKDNEISQAVDQLKKKTDEISTLKNELEKSKRENDELKYEKKQLQKMNDELEIEKEQFEMTIQQLRKEKSTGDANVKTKGLVEKYEMTEKELKRAKEEIDELKNRKQTGNTIKENTEEIARLKNDLLEIKRYCKDAFEKLDQKDKMISQLQESLKVPTAERNPTPTTRYGAVSTAESLQFLSR